MTELEKYVPLQDRSDDEIRNQAEENMRGGAPCIIAPDATVERDDDAESALVQVWVSVCPWDFPASTDAFREQSL